jgi:hypothetical protein
MRDKKTAQHHEGGGLQSAANKEEIECSRC